MHLLEAIILRQEAELERTTKGVLRGIALRALDDYAELHMQNLHMAEAIDAVLDDVDKEALLGEFRARHGLVSGEP